MTLAQQLLASTVGAAILIGSSATAAQAQYVIYENQPVYVQERVYVEEPVRVRRRVRRRYSRPGFSFGIGSFGVQFEG